MTYEMQERLHAAAESLRQAASDVGYGTSFGFARRLRHVIELTNLLAVEASVEPGAQEDEIQRQFAARVRLLLDAE